MRTADAIYPDLLPTLPGVPEPMVERALLRAAQDLCRRARVWKVWTDPVTVASGVTEYDVELPSYAQVELIERSTRNGIAAVSVPSSFMVRAVEDGAGRILVPGRWVFHVLGAQAGEVIRHHVVLSPTDSSPGVPDEVFDPYSDVLCSGVRAQLMAVPGQPFTNLQLAAAHAAAFDSSVTKACLRAWRGYTDQTPRASTRWC